jgi:ribosomal protein L37E
MQQLREISMETSPIARALETLAGPWLAPLASVLRTLAIVALIAALIVSAIQIAAGLLAWKYGWERGTVVRCRRCGRLAVDRETSVCPQGHPVRFPPGARSRVRQFGARWTIVWRTYGLLVPVATGALALWGYAALRPGPLRLSVSALLASTAYLFFLAALSCAAWALSPQPRGALGRALHLILAALCLTPVLPLALMAQWIEPPAREPLGSLWTTPTATYLSAGRGRARRVARAATHAEAMIVEVRVPALGVVWQGLKGFRVAGAAVDWSGRGGWIARRLEGWTGPLTAHGVWLSRFDLPVALPPNERIWIVRDGRQLRFLREAEMSVPELPPARVSAAASRDNPAL